MTREREGERRDRERKSERGRERVDYLFVKDKEVKIKDPHGMR